jgi:hypothetical protein
LSPTHIEPLADRPETWQELQIHRANQIAFSNRIGAKGFACREVIAANLGDGAGVEIGGV